MRINNVTYLDGYQLKVKFHNGVEKLVNLESWLKSQHNPSISQYLDLNKFKNVRLESGFLSWDNGEMELSGDTLLND